MKIASFLRSFRKHLYKELPETGFIVRTCTFGINPKGITATVIAYTPVDGTTIIVWLVVSRRTFKVISKRWAELVS